MNRANGSYRTESRLTLVMRGWVARWLARPPRRTAPRRLRAAIVKLDRLGDAVLAVGTIRTILRHYGESECLLVVSPQVEALFAAEFPTAPRLVLPMAVMHRQLWQLGNAYREMCADYVCEEVISLRHQREDWDELVLVWLGGRRTCVLDPVPGGRDFTPPRTFTWERAERVTFAADGSGGLCRELARHRQLTAVLLKRAVGNVEIWPRFERLGRRPSGQSILVSRNTI